MKQFNWLVTPMNKDLFDGITEFLLKEKNFVQSRSSRLKSEICKLVALTSRDIDVKADIYDIFLENMYRNMHFGTSFNFLKKDVSGIIMQKTLENNITISETTSICADPKVRN